MTETQQLLADYAETGSETAFHELVARYIDLVHAAAMRLVNGDSHLAQDISQTVFADLARTARTLSRDTMLGGWLHRHTVFVASKVIRGEKRRQLRERQAVEMNFTEDHSAENLAAIRPVLDEAINELGTDDRKAILLRYFEQNDLRSVGAALGSSEDGARKRVDRALEKLHRLLTRRGIALSVTAVGTVLSTEAVSAAPTGLALTISGTALAAAATSGATTLTILKIMSMTKMKVAIITVIIAAGVAIPLAVQHQNTVRLRQEKEALSKKAQQAEQLAAENERLSTQLAEAKNSAPPTNDQSREMLKLRGEVAKLKTAVNGPRPKGPSALSELRNDTNMWKTIREQQKMGMGMIYKEFATRMKLPKEKSDKLTETLADDVMDNIDRITEVLRDGKTGDEMSQVFTDQEAVLSQKMKDLLGDETFSKYQDYTHNLASYLTAEQFKSELAGDKKAKDGKAKQLSQLMQEEISSRLTSEGLPPDYQILPMLNFRNIASEDYAEQSLKRMDEIFGKVEERATTFLSPKEQESFKKFHSTALNNNKMALAMNRKLMAPVPK